MAWYDTCKTTGYIYLYLICVVYWSDVKIGFNVRKTALYKTLDCENNELYCG